MNLHQENILSIFIFNGIVIKEYAVSKRDCYSFPFLYKSSKEIMSKLTTTFVPVSAFSEFVLQNHAYAAQSLLHIRKYFAI
jgi:hypothetical protein